MTDVGPFSTMTEAAQHLRRPFTPEAVKWKAQSFLGMKDKKPETAKGALIVAHIDARLVVERLNLLCPEWHDHYELIQNGARCDLTVCGVTRSGYGLGRDVKAAESDALKRAGVKFGIGVSLYAMQSVTLWRVAGEEQAGNKLRPNWKGHLDLDDANRKWLGEMYGRWLAEGRGKSFGEPLDHGDEFGAVGDPEDPDVQPTDAPADPGQDAEMERLRAEVEVAYVSRGDRRRLPPGKYKARLEAASTPEDLRALLTDVEAPHNDTKAAA